MSKNNDTRDKFHNLHHFSKVLTLFEAVSRRALYKFSFSTKHDCNLSISSLN